MKKITHEEANLLEYIKQQEDKDKEYETELKIAIRTIKTLQQSLHELNISDKGKEESSMQYFNDYKDLKRKYNKVIKLLELYRNYLDDTDKVTWEQIKELEKELEITK